MQFEFKLYESQLESKQCQNTFSVRVGGATAYLGGATAYLGGATAYLGGATAYLVGGKMNLRIRLTSAKVRVGVEVEAELGNKKTHRIKSKFN